MEIGMCGIKVRRVVVSSHTHTHTAGVFGHSNVNAGRLTSMQRLLSHLRKALT